MKFSRISVDPRQMGGVPCIRSLRIPVATVIGMVADGMSEAQIIASYPDLAIADIHESLRYAAEAMLVPCADFAAGAGNRPLGLLRGKGRFSLDKDFAVRDQDLLAG